MKCLGHISIQGNKIVFVYQGKCWFPDNPIFDDVPYKMAMEEYQASKRSINLPCEAEIIDNKATIVKIL